MKVTIKLDYAKIKRIEKAAKEAAVEAMEATVTNVMVSKRVPMDSGELQDSLFVSSAEENGTFIARLDHSQLYGRYLYYHPEYDFQQTEGANGSRGAYWLDPWIIGDKMNYVQDKFIEIFRRRAGL